MTRFMQTCTILHTVKNIPILPKNKDFSAFYDKKICNDIHLYAMEIHARFQLSEREADSG